MSRSHVARPGFLCRRAASLAAALLTVSAQGTARASPADTPASGSLSAGDSSSSPSPAQPADGDSPRNEGLFGPIRIGAFGGIGLPRPLSIEGMVKIGDLVGVGLEYSVLPKVSASGVDVTLSAIDVDLRVFPFRNGFFVGVAGGRQEFTAASTLALPSGLGSLSEQISAETWFVNPRIGFLWAWSWFTVGIDAGAQIPITASYTNTIPSELTVSQTASDVSHFFGQDVIPTINLLRLGAML